MAITAKLYGAVLEHALSKRIDWDNDTIKITLHTSGYTPNQDTHKYFNQTTNQLPTGNGYTSGGITLTGKTLNYDAATNTLVLDANDVTFPQGSITWRTAVIWVDTGTDSTSPLIAYFQSDSDIVSTNGTTTVNMPVDGIVRLQAD